jgi:hypothetical protein
MCITVPPVYPLEPCQIEIMHENLEEWRLLLVIFAQHLHSNTVADIFLS